jgi:anaphase-promoting complex subunit 2
MKTGMLLLWFFHYFQMPVIDFMEAALKENWTASSSAERAAKSLRRLFKIRTFAIFQQSLQPEMISVAVTELTHKTLLAEFQLGPRGSQVLDSTEGCNSKESILLMQSLSALAAVDLGGPSVMRATARGIEYCIPLFIYSRWMEVDWANGNPIIDNLVHWVENGLKPMVERMMLALHPTNTPNVDAEAKLWLAMAIEELGKARVQKMFSYISWWPGSKGAIMDLKVSLI